MLATMQRQMDQSEQQMNRITVLQEENQRLRMAAAAQNNVNTARQSTKKPERPSVIGGMGDRDWAVFLDDWSRYKIMAALRDEDAIRMELRACCVNDVNKILFEFVGPTRLNGCTEDELLTHIKSVAVKSVHKEVHRMNFNKIEQNDGESITSYVARLKAQAFLCEFAVPCPCTPAVQVSYAEEMVAQRLIAGLVNQEHQRRVLSEAATLVTLEDKVKKLKMLETTEESTVVLRTTTSSSEASLIRSQYKKQQVQQKKDSGNSTENKSTKCRWCGRTSHPNGKPLDRTYCPAQEKKCFGCNTLGHLKTVCEKSRSSATEVDEENESENGQLQVGTSASFSFATEDFRHGQIKNKTP